MQTSCNTQLTVGAHCVRPNPEDSYQKGERNSPLQSHANTPSLPHAHTPSLPHANTPEPPHDHTPSPPHAHTPEPPLVITPLNSAIRYPVTVGRNVRYPKQITIRDIAYVMEAIKTGWYEGYDLKRHIANIRSLKNAVDIKNTKMALPWWCGSCIKDSRANSNVVRAWFMVFDLDHVKDIEAVKAQAIAKLPWLRYAFSSVTDGVKLVAQFTKPITDEAVYRQVYLFLAMQIEWAVKQACDNTPDWSRACFMSWDPELLHNARCLPLDAQVAYKQACSLVNVERSRGLEVERMGERNSPLQPKPNSSSVGADCVRPTPEDDYPKAERIISILCQIPIHYNDWVKIGMALQAGFGERGKPLWDMFVSNPNYKDSQRIIDTHWHSFRGVTRITLASLFYLAEKYGIKGE